MSKNTPEVLCGLTQPLDAANAPALPPFDERVKAFLSELSAVLLKDKRCKTFPDVTTFAFFCRRAHLERLQSEQGDLSGRIGRGMVFHIAPSNVPINFAYSLVSALLAGNACVVKASSRGFEQTNLVCEAMRGLLDGAHAALRPYVNVVVYPRERQDLTEAYSAVCDARVIWGGDETVRRVREAPLAPRAFDVAFADRWSLLLIAVDAVNALDDKALQAVAQGFYNDTYFSDQNACTSPRLVYWLGDDERAQTRFWQAVYDYAAPRYPIEPVVAVDKRVALYRAALTLSGARLAPMRDNLVTRIRLDALTPEAADFHCAGGCFLEYASDSLDALAPLLGKKTQTISYLGVAPADIRRFVLERGARGVDRIAPVGQTMDFALTWDGYDLINQLSRRVFIA